MKHFRHSLALILALSIALSGCTITPSAPSDMLIPPPSQEPAVSPASLAETEKKDFDIQYFTDRTDKFYEYASVTNVAFVVTTEQGRYHFSDNEIPLDMVYEYIEAFESGIRYANEWFGQGNIVLDLYFIQRDFETEYSIGEVTIGGGGADGVAWVEYDYSLKSPPSPFYASHVLMHEAIHALCYVHSETTNFPKRPEPYPFFWSELFEEGLATMLELIYGYNNGRLHDVYMYHYTEGGYRSSEGALGEVSNVAEALNHLALFSIEENDFYDELPYDVLQDYFTSASFLYYLLEHNGNKEDLRRVYADITLMEEVYGKDMDGMIEEWLKYLEQNN